jgi:hypothetical protein
MSPAPTNAKAQKTVTPGDLTLQEALHVLLSRLAATMELIRNWPEASGDDASIHVETTSKLITSIREVIVQLQAVEGVVQSDANVRKSLNECLIPMDLLDLMDSNLNPECFSRGLIREALGQLAGLKRRKLALELLGAAVQSGLNKRLSLLQDSNVETKKRSRDDNDEDSSEPPNKKQQLC